MTPESTRWNFWMPSDLMEKTKKLAKNQHVSASDVVRKALATYIAAVEKAENAKRAAQEPVDVA